LLIAHHPDHVADILRLLYINLGENDFADVAPTHFRYFKDKVAPIYTDINGYTCVSVGEAKEEFTAVAGLGK
jgi:hypothetical protein